VIHLLGPVSTEKSSGPMTNQGIELPHMCLKLKTTSLKRENVWYHFHYSDEDD